MLMLPLRGLFWGLLGGSVLAVCAVIVADACLLSGSLGGPGVCLAQLQPHSLAGATVCWLQWCGAGVHCAAMRTALHCHSMHMPATGYPAQGNIIDGSTWQVPDRSWIMTGPGFQVLMCFVLYFECARVLAGPLQCMCTMWH